MATRYQTFLHLLVLSFGGLAPILWFGGDRLLPGGIDFMFPLEPLRSLNIHSYAYNEAWGIDNVQLIPYLVPWDLVLSSLYLLTSNIVLSEKVFFVMIFTLPGVSMYYLLRVLVRTSFNGLMLVGPLVYMYNPYVIALWRAGEQVQLLAYGSLPLLIGLMIVGLSRKKLEYSLAVAVASLLFATSASWPPIYLTTWIFALLFVSSYSILSMKVSFKRLAKFVACVLAFTTVANLWWLLPLIKFGTTTFPFDYIFSPLSTDLIFQIKLNASATSIQQLLRMLGMWSWFTPDYGNYHLRFSDPIHVVAGLALPVIACGCIYRRKYAKLALISTVFLVLGVFMAKSVHEPFSFVNQFIYLNVPYAWMFVNNFQNFTMIIAFSISIMIGIVFAGELSGTLRKKLAALILVGLILYNASPVFTSEVLPEESFYVPTYYSDAGRYVNSQPGDFNILILPPVTYYESYKWGYVGPDILLYFVTKSTLTGSHGFPLQSELTKLAYNETLSNPTYQFTTALYLLNVRYVWLDTSLVHPETDKIVGYMRNLSATDKQITYVRTFGNITLFENRYYLPRLYTSTDLFLYEGPTEGLLKKASVFAGTPQTNPVFITQNQYEAVGSPVINGTHTRVTNYELVSPVEYRVHVESDGSFFLVLNLPFLPSWVVTDNNAIVDGHVLANGYGAAWYIDGPGDHVIKVYYQPQSYFYIGGVASFIFLSLVVLYFFLRRSSLRVKLPQHRRHHVVIQEKI